MRGLPFYLVGAGLCFVAALACFLTFVGACAGLEAEVGLTSGTGEIWALVMALVFIVAGAFALSEHRRKREGDR